MAPDSFGGIGLVVGRSGPLWLNVTRDTRHSDPKQYGMECGFILLLLVGATGFALLWLRDTSYMALFPMLPYGKFAQRWKDGIYRSAALLTTSKAHAE